MNNPAPTSVNVTLTITTDPPAGLVEVLVPTAGAVTVEEPEHGALAWSGTGAVAAELPFRIRPPTWGLLTLGPVWVRVHGPLGLTRARGCCVYELAGGA